MVNGFYSKDTLWYYWNSKILLMVVLVSSWTLDKVIRYRYSNYLLKMHIKIFNSIPTYTIILKRLSSLSNAVLKNAYQIVYRIII
jgi:hypothetical protein